jgi:hypothetical protein
MTRLGKLVKQRTKERPVDVKIDDTAPLKAQAPSANISPSSAPLTRKHRRFTRLDPRYQGPNMRLLEIGAAQARARAKRMQDQFDRERREERDAVLAKIEHAERYGAKERRAKALLQINARSARRRLAKMM